MSFANSQGDTPEVLFLTRVYRAMWMQYPSTESLYGVDDQYLIGDALLVKPVTAPGVTSSNVKFPTDDVWYDAESLVRITEKSKAGGVVEKAVSSDINTIPVFQRGGSVITRKLRLRRSSYVMKKDPYTLYVALSGSKKAQGLLYMDDEETFDHATQEQYALSTFDADFSQPRCSIQCTVKVGAGWSGSLQDMIADRMVERIIVMGVEKSPKSITVNGADIDFNYESGSKVLVLRKPNVSTLKEWEIIVDL